ncbi:MAG TPA: CPBP family intramembrane glutamic endopeptidase [Verrucomicrobiae bacterium]|nr:CPBP family intramembrane glutamic endopeptidase [Verrucomicrobiae bacterium]
MSNVPVSHVLSEPISPIPNDVSARPVPMRLRPMVVLVLVFLAMASWGALAQHRSAAHSSTLQVPASPAAIYAGLILMEWGLVYYVWKAALGGSTVSLRDLIGGRWKTLRDVAVDVAIGLLTWGAWTLASWLWVSWARPDSAASVDSLLPHRPHEIALWILLSLSAGFGEELVFRGYLQRQFHALTASAPLALVLQAALFGVSHGYQGVFACTRIFVYGLLFGGLAIGRRSLRPGMVAHAWTDIASGLLLN